MRLVVHRELYNLTPKSTPGVLFVDGKRFCYTLEDALRHPAVKIPKHTCIPSCTLAVGISYSTRFKRNMSIFYNQRNGYEAVVNGHSWKGLRAHGGNDVTHTEGCLLVAEHRIDNDTIQGSMESELTRMIQKAVDNGEKVKITWVNNG